MFRENFGYDDVQCFRTGWPMEYLKTMFTPKKKEDIILFPHRIAPEKQVEIFRDLAKEMPEYKFIVCQDTRSEERRVGTECRSRWSQYH